MDWQRECKILAYLSILFSFQTIAEPLVRTDLVWEIFASRHTITDVFAMPDTLWIATHGGLEQRQFSDGQLISVHSHINGLPSSQVNAVTQDKQGNLWVGTDNGIAYRNSTGQWTVFTADNSDLPNHSVTHIVTDNVGGIWVAVGGQFLDSGIFHLDGTGKRRYFLPFGNLLQQVNALVSDGNNGIWVASVDFDGLVHVDDSGEHLVVDADTSPLPSWEVNALDSDGQGGLWIGTRNGLAYRSVVGEWQIFKAEDTYLPDNTVDTVVSDGSDGVWVEAKGRLAHLNRSGQSIDYPYNEEYQLIGSDGQGGVWLAAWQNGARVSLARMASDRRWQTFPEELEQVSQFKRLVSDRNGGVWVEITSGLAHLDKNRHWQFFDLAGNIIYLWEEDDSGGVWSITSNGVLHISTLGEMTQYDIAFDIPPQQVSEIERDGLGGLWMRGETYSSGFLGLIHLSALGEWRAFNTDNSDIPHNFINALKYDGQKRLWVHAEGQIIISDNADFSWKILPNAVYFYSLIFSNGEGGVWMGYYDRVNFWENALLQRTFTDFSIGHLATTAEKDHLWTVDDIRITYLDDKTGTKIFPRDALNIPCLERHFAQIFALADDENAGVWVATKTGGVFHVDDMGFATVFNTAQSLLPADTMQDFISDDMGGFWAVTGNGNFLVHLGHKITLPVLEAVNSVDATNTPITTQTTLVGGISVNEQPYQHQVTHYLADILDIQGRIVVDPQHIGLLADIILYTTYKDETGVAEPFFMLDEQNHALVWDGDPANLVAFHHKIVLPTEQSVYLYQGQMPASGVYKLFFGYRLVDGTLIVNETPLVVNTLAMPDLGPGQAVDSDNNSIATTTLFSGGVVVNDRPYQATVEHGLTEVVEVTANITVDPTHVNQLADIFVYSVRGLPLFGETEKVMLGEDGRIVVWDGDFASIIPLRNQVRLGSQQRVPIYQGLLRFPGTLEIYLGYRLANGTTVTSTQPINMMITE